MFVTRKNLNEEFIRQSVFKTAYNGPIHPGMHRNIFSLFPLSTANVIIFRS